MHNLMKSNGQMLLKSVFHFSLAVVLHHGELGRLHQVCRNRNRGADYEIVTRVAAAAIFSEQLAAKVPLQAEGLAEDALNAKLASEPPMVAALARRTLRNVEVAAVARRTQASQGGNVMMGAQAVQNARALASALAPCKQADVADLLQKHHLRGLSFHLQADQCLFDSLTAHTEEAKKQGRVPFASVDLASKECLPLWIPSDAVGGRFAVRDEDEMALTGASPIANLGDLGRALKGATAVPRFFRSLQLVECSILEMGNCGRLCGSLENDRGRRPP